MSTIDSIMNNKGALIVLAIIAFLLAAVLVLIIVRMLFGGRLRLPGGRARQARLGIVDAFDLDRQRQLIIVRRDNTEHLIMIGGPNDMLIESQIVRAETRDVRRDKAIEGAFSNQPAVGDGRIPAPLAANERAEPIAGGAPFPNDELLPMPGVAAESATPRVYAEPPPQRTPTFPLPPRRPAPVQERRPPPMLPESVSRNDVTVPVAGPPLAEAPRSTEAPRPVEAPRQVEAPQPIETPQPQASDTPTVIVPPQPAPEPPTAPEPSPAPVETPTPVGAEPLRADPPVAQPPASPRPVPPSFLKPLPPRPPIRPLRRTTPQPAFAAPPPAAEPMSQPAAPAASQPMAQAAPPPPPATVVPPPPAPPPPAPQPAPETKDALESLEEEMAKLLGRGPS